MSSSLGRLYNCPNLKFCIQLEAPTMSMNFNPNLTVSAMDPRKLISSCERDSVGEGFPADE